MMLRLLAFLFLLQWTLVVNAEPLLGFYGSAQTSSSASHEKWLNRATLFTWNGGSVNYYLNGVPSWHLDPLSAWLKARPGRQMVYTFFIFKESRAGYSNQTLAACGQGAYDADYVKFAKALERYKMTNIILRIGHEHTGDWYSWSSKGKEGSFANCYRRVVQTLRNAVPSNNWKFDWNPVGNQAVSLLNATYPGDAYVDYITTDIYDTSKYAGRTYPYPVDCDGNCRYQRQYTNWYYTKAILDIYKNFAKSKNKPFGITEWGLWSERHIKGNHNGGGDNVYFITKMHQYIHDPANNLAYSVYFDVDTAEGNHKLCCDTNGEFPKASAKFQQLFGSSLKYLSTDALPASVEAGSSVNVRVNVSSNTLREDFKIVYSVFDSTGSRVVYLPTTQDIKISQDQVLPATLRLPSTLKSGNYKLSFSIYEAKFEKKYMFIDRIGTIVVKEKAVVVPEAQYSFSNTKLNSTNFKTEQTLKLDTDITLVKAEKVFVRLILYGTSGIRLADKTYTLQPASENSVTPISYSLVLPAHSPKESYKISAYVQRASDYKTLLFVDRLAQFQIVP